MSVTRREFILRLAAALAGVAGARAARAQQAPQGTAAPMEGSAYRPVRLPPKERAGPSMDAAARDALEHRLKCACGCPLDVYTCRTTDFTCPVSPAMHRDVLALVDGGYTEEEILGAFVDVYGERALTAPKAEGFNRLAYVAPYLAFGGGAAAAALFIRKWMRTPDPLPETHTAAPDATPEELARLREALRTDGR